MHGIKNIFRRNIGVAIGTNDPKEELKKALKLNKEAGINLFRIYTINGDPRCIEVAQLLRKELGNEVLPGDAWIEQDVDILFPCALENQITEKNVTKIKSRVRLIAEGANGPTTPEADKVIHERGIYLLPDFLANAGGVTCSYFEQVQSNMNYYWTKEEVLEKLDQKMTHAYHEVHKLAQKRKVYMRDAAYMIAINRVAQASKERGWV